MWKSLHNDTGEEQDISLSDNINSLNSDFNDIMWH